MNQWRLLLLSFIPLAFLRLYSVRLASEGRPTVRCIGHERNFGIVSLFFIQGVWSLIQVLRAIRASQTLVVLRCLHLDDALTSPNFLLIFQQGRPGEVYIVADHVWHCHNGLTP